MLTPYALREKKLDSTSTIVFTLKKGKKTKEVKDAKFHAPAPPHIQRLTEETLNKALITEDYSLIVKCLEKGIDPEGFFFGNDLPSQKSPLYKAFSKKNFRISSLMLQGDFNEKEEHEEEFMPVRGFKSKATQKCTLIDLAIKNDDIYAYNILCEIKAHRHSKFKAWYLCLYFGACAIMQGLLSKKLFLKNPQLDGFPSINGKPPLHLALETFPLENYQNHILLIKLLLEHAPEMVLLKDDRGITPYHLATKKNLPLEVCQLIKTTWLREKTKLDRESSEEVSEAGSSSSLLRV